MENEFFSKFNNHIFIIAEAGSNWKCGTYEDDLNQAKNLIDIASNSGADAIKFQTYRPETTYVKNAGMSKYLEENNIHENINKIFKNLSMPYKMIPELANYCKKKNILFMSTPFSVQDAKEIDPFVRIHKIASFEINHLRLLEFLANTNKPIILSTGASTISEIQFAVDFIKSKNNSQIGLLQCTSKYPAKINSLNLKVIESYKQNFPVVPGLSDHSEDPIIGPLLAVGVGAKIIEKHFTISRELPGPDHSFALEPDELKKMIQHIRQAELGLGNKTKSIIPEEEELRNFATRRIQSITDISKGDILKEGVNFEILRPGNRLSGLEARFLEDVEGKKATKDIQSGDGILDFE